MADSNDLKVDKQLDCAGTDPGDEDDGIAEAWVVAAVPDSLAP